MSYRSPGTKIEEIQGSVTASSGSTRRTPCFIGTASAYIKINYEKVVRGASGQSDALAKTPVHAVSFVGSQKGLKDYVQGTHYTVTSTGITWATTAGLTYPAAGATYYVTYSYNRPDTDYAYKEFTTFDALTADLGAIDPASTLVMLGDLSFNYFNLPKIAVVQTKADTDAAYLTALKLCEHRDVQTIGITKSSSAVRTAGINHVVERSLPDNKRFRTFFTGAASDTPLGTYDSLTDCIAKSAYAIKNERVLFVNAPRALYYYTSATDNSVTLSTVVDGAFIAAAIGAYRDSFIDPTTTLINRTVPGLYLFPEDYDNYYSDPRLVDAGTASCFIVKNSGDAMLVEDDLTTDNTSVERNNYNIITAKDYLAKDVINQMTRTFKGTLIKNRDLYKNNVYSFLQGLLSQYVANGYIESIDKITVTLPENRRDTVEFFYSYYAVYTGKYFDGKFSIAI